jgi:hypothetical protein
MYEGAKPDEEEAMGVAYENPDRDADHSLTQWLMGDFLHHLHAAPTLPALDYLKEAFGHILDLPAWTIRGPHPGEPWPESLGPDERGERREYMVIGRPVMPEFLDNLTDAAEKLLAAAPAEWGAITEPVPNSEAPLTATEGTSPEPATADARDIPALVAWLKRVTPEWPPIGIDWPLVLSHAEELFAGCSQPDAAAAEHPQEGEELADYLRACFNSEPIQRADPFSRGYACACQLLDAFALLEAFCMGSLAVGYDLDAIDRPVKQLPPFHGLMCLGWVMVELIRSLRDVSKADFDAVSEAAAQPVQVGAAFGRNAHQAVWNLANEICRLSEFVTEGHLAVSRMGDQAPGAMEYTWAKLSQALEGRFPDSLKMKQLRIQLECESRTAFSRAFPASLEAESPIPAAGNPDPPAKNPTDQGNSTSAYSPQPLGGQRREAVDNTSHPAPFHLLAFELLDIDGLPLPRMDGYRGDPYLTDEHYQELCIRVCELVPGQTAKEWWDASPGQRIALMRSALAARRAPLTPSALSSSPIPAAKKPKRSTERGEGRAKLIAALTAHHKYANDGCLNLEPIGNNELARKADVSESTASAFFEKEFKGHLKYRAACNDAVRLVAALKLLNGEYSPHVLFGGTPPGEGKPDDE